MGTAGKILWRSDSIFETQIGLLTQLVSNSLCAFRSGVKQPRLKYEKAACHCTFVPGHGDRVADCRQKACEDSPGKNGRNSFQKPPIRRLLYA